jgi:glycosyltransferase involved in cell wall biosynthesis
MIDSKAIKKLKVSLLTGGQDIYYALGLLSGLVLKEINVEFIGNDAMEDAEVTKSQNVIYYNLRRDQSPNAPMKNKIVRVLKYYFKLIKYAAKTDSNCFHILWLNKFTYFDRTLMNVYYKMLGKKLLFTAHDINFRKLVGKDTTINRLTLRFMYKIVDHIIVHTGKMKEELIESFKIRKDKISVIPFGINDVIPSSNLTRAEGKRKLNLENGEKIMLFFGNIAPYKGLDQLIKALVYLKERIGNLKLVVAGRIKHRCQAYWNNIEKLIKDYDLNEYIIKRIEFIPGEEAEIYFKSADVLILPYKNIFQSGLIYTSYSFGLPVVATDVGSLRDDIIEGKTGFVCSPNDPEDLARKITLFYESNLFKDLEANRKEIIQYAKEKYSWEKAGDKTYEVYKKMIRK